MSDLENILANKETLEGLEAYLDSLEGDPNIALAKIVGKTDPDNVRRRLAILINNSRLEEAAAEARASEKSATWVDLAVYSCAVVGASADAREFIEWARSLPKKTFWQRSVIRNHDGTLHGLFRARNNAAAIIPGGLAPNEETAIRRNLDLLETACAPIVSSGQVSTQLELQLLSRFFDASYLLQSYQRCRDIIKVLETRTPIPLKVGQAVLQKIVEPLKTVVDRLWNEHGESFRPRLLACLIQSRVFNNDEIALTSAYDLVKLARSETEKEELCQLIYELTGFDNPAALARAKETATALLGEQSRFLTIVGANDLLRQGDAPGALAAIERSDLVSDPQGMRIKAIATLNVGKPIEALHILQELAKVAPEPQILRMVSDLARKHNRDADEREALEQLLALAPTEEIGRKRISWLYARRSDYERAAKHLEVLHQQIPNDAEVTANLAIVYSFQGQNERALLVLDEFGPRDSASLTILKTRVQILSAQGRHLEAFDALEAARGNFWDNPQFLLLYLGLGHAADREANAHEAMKKLLELKQAGGIDDALFHAASLDELREFMAGTAKRNEAIKQFIVQGRLPWLSGAEMQHEAMYWAWTMRTQPLTWLFDDANNRASYCIYATNGFRVLNKANELSTLTQITSAGKGGTIVADASALMTLHSLGLLQRVSEHFEDVLVPASYLPKIISDTRQLFPHQSSRKRAAEAIRAAVDRKQITLDAEDALANSMSILDEYNDDPEPILVPYRLRDVIDFLHSKGFVTDSQFERARAVAHKNSTVGQKHPPLELGSTICIEETTLDTLAGIGMLDVVTQHFSVHINRKAFDDVLSRIRGFQLLEAALSKHRDLWDTIQASKRFRFISVNEAPAISDREEQDRSIATAAYLAAKQENLPLLVDDRVCQSLLINDWKEHPFAAFGTDVLVQEMGKSGSLTLDEAADALIKLIDWRYRFVSASPEILKLLSDRYRTHPPGSALRKVAIYIHDCMRDEGLFGGLEATTPPVSIAMRLYQTWAQNVAEFVMDIWLDENNEDNRAADITTWAMMELLPSPPRVADLRLQSTLAAFTPRIVLTWALLRSIQGTNLERINKALQSMSSALGLSEKEYFEIVAGAANGI